MQVLELIVSVFMEAFLIVGSGLSIIGIRLKPSKIASIGAIYSLVVYGIRELYKIKQIPLGTHSFVIMILFFIILKYIGKQKWSAAIIATLISFLLLTLGEGMIMYNVAKLFNISVKDIISKPGLRFLGTILSDVGLILIFIIGYVFKFSIIDLDRLSEKEEI